MALQTYDDLKETISDYILRSDAPVASFIALAEADIQPMLKHYMMEHTVVLPAASGRVVFPPDFLEARSIRIDGVVAKPVSAYNAVLYPGEIGYFFDGNAIAFVGTTTFPVDVELAYYSRVPSLSASNQTNWLLTKFPAVYLHSSLARAYRWLKNTEAEVLEKQTLSEAIGLLGEDHRRAMRGGNTIITGGKGSW
ncbi:phage adaptor protein [Agrobacterium rosae]|uniref:phage adaptor protein n=1 Tax=Agrobacterium rosae TaxID=1972867 RepID=UPI003BA1417E